MNHRHGIAIVVLASVLGWALLHQVRRSDDERVVVRVAHRFLHEGIREALDEIARNFERENPGVVIEYLEVPQNLWVSWITTRLLGGNPPELINSGHLTDEQTSRFLEPLTPYLREPNPNNVGTALEGVAWRDTFVNGLNDNYNFHAQLMDYYAVPTSFNTRRFFYNRDLFRRVLGEDEPPSTYLELIEVCRLLTADARERGVSVAPIASSFLHARWLLALVHQHFTQNLAARLDSYQAGDWGLLDAMVEILRGSWQPSAEPMRSSWLTFRELGGFFQAGFLSADREQATLLFLQEKAGMLFSASWDAQMVFSGAPFDVGVFALALPEHDATATNSLRPVSETNVALGGSFSVVRTAPNWREGLDFLHFLTSQRQNQVFARHSFRLPAVIGVEPATEVRSFVPRIEGAPPGVSFDGLESFGGGMSQMVIDRNLHRLLALEDDPEVFLSIVARELPLSARQDLVRYASRLRDVIARQEVLYLARSVVSANDDPALAALREQINQQVLMLARVEATLTQS